VDRAAGVTLPVDTRLGGAQQALHLTELGVGLLQLGGPAGELYPAVAPVDRRPRGGGHRRSHEREHRPAAAGHASGPPGRHSPGRRRGRIRGRPKGCPPDAFSGNNRLNPKPVPLTAKGKKGKGKIEGRQEGGQEKVVAGAGSPALA
jgi:hypothetical protein